jgi:cob(I)alamin adenosyltransferase
MSFKIHTKKGDEGNTSLADGTVISKSDSLIKMYGEIDTLNSFTGDLVSFVGHNLDLFNSYSLKVEKQIKFLQLIQSQLLVIGSNFACPVKLHEKFKIPKFNTDIILEIENHIDEMDKELDPLKNFILPGGGIAASKSHILRCKTREAERNLISLNIENENFIINTKAFLNRLSDYFFILARFLNKSEAIDDILWNS